LSKRRTFGRWLYFIGPPLLGVALGILVVRHRQPQGPAKQVANPPTPAWSESFSGHVVKVYDGDTIEVLHDQESVTIRLYGIDAPERHEPYANKARQFLADLVWGKDVEIDVKDMDKYGRTVGIVKLADGKIANHELVRVGYARWYRYFAPADRDLESLEAEARAARRGIWAALPTRRIRVSSGSEARLSK